MQWGGLKMNLQKKEFNKGYDKVAFYSVMGEYFAEKKYRDEMPYLINNEEKEWRLCVGCLCPVRIPALGGMRRYGKRYDFLFFLYPHDHLQPASHHPSPQERLPGIIQAGLLFNHGMREYRARA